MREEAMGDDADIIVEIHYLHGTKLSYSICEGDRKYRIFLYEEPIHPLNSDNMQKVSRSTTIPIATGERSTRWGYAGNYWRSDLLPLAQPDLCNTAAELPKERKSVTMLIFMTYHCTGACLQRSCFHI